MEIMPQWQHPLFPVLVMYHIQCLGGEYSGPRDQEYIIKERREYRTRLCSALNVCGESRAWNANHVRLLAWECAGTFVYYNVFGNGRQIISIPSA